MDGHNWLQFSHGALPQDAVPAGHDADGDAIYVGRAFHNNDLLPAKVIPNKSKAYVAYGNEEVELDKYEVLTGFNYEWLPGANGGVPDAAVPVGRNVDGEVLYAGRGYHAGSLTLGKVHPSHGCLYIPFGAEEIKIYEYEVLSRLIQMR